MLTKVEQHKSYIKNTNTMEERIYKFMNREINHSHKERCVTTAELQSITDILDELGFKWKHLDADRLKTSHMFIDVFYDDGPKMFIDGNNHKFLIPNYVRGRKPGNQVCTISLNYTWQRDLEEGKPAPDFREHVSVDFNLKGAHWYCGHKQVIVAEKPSGMTWVYTYGTIKDNLDTIRESLTVLKKHLDNGEPFPKTKKK